MLKNLNLHMIIENLHDFRRNRRLNMHLFSFLFSLLARKHRDLKIHVPVTMSTRKNGKEASEVTLTASWSFFFRFCTFFASLFFFADVFSSIIIRFVRKCYLLHNLLIFQIFQKMC